MTPRAPRRRHRLPPDAARWLACGAAAAAAALASHYFGLSLCPLKRLAGIPCPSCGTTRACLALLRGDVRTALAIQPFALAALAALLACALSPRLRALAAALWARTSVKLLCAALLLADWLYVLHRAN